MTTQQINDLTRQLAEARRENSPVRARALLRKVAQQCQELLRRGQEPARAAVLGSSALADLASLETDLEKRLEYRRRAIAVCRRALQRAVSVDATEAYANRIVDHFYDQFASEEQVRMRTLLASVIRELDRAIEQEHSPHERARLLIQKSSVLRCQSLIPPKEWRTRRADEAVRCAQKAVVESPNNPYSHLELAQALWATARQAESDDEYASILNHAEQSLQTAQRESKALPRLVLSRFFRLTYRPAKAVGAFEEYASIEPNRRRLLAETFVYGEAAMQLWYNQYEESLVERSLCRARDLLREATDAGYENARIYVALAFTEAALGDVELAETTLGKLARRDVDSWLNVIEKAQQAVEQFELDALAQAFALGILDSSIWNALGTYSTHFLEDDELAIQLYQIGRRLGPRDPIILTNLARVLIRLGGSNNLAEAKRLLQQAASYADRGFTWWREVVKQMDEARGRKRKSPRRIPLRRDSRVRRKDIQRLFEALDSGQYKVQERGYAFERLFVDLLRITFGVYDVKGKHSVGSPSFEVDAAFTYDELHYRVELKWRKRRTDLSEIATFEKALETAGVAGLFVSMSGYTDRAIKTARDLAKTRRILLVDGEEIRAVVYGGLGFQTLLEKKQSHFLTYGEPYVRTHNKRMVGVRPIESDSITARPQRE